MSRTSATSAGAAVSIPSRRSSTPPWPGIRLLASFAPKRRLTNDIPRSPPGRPPPRRRPGCTAARGVSAPAQTANRNPQSAATAIAPDQPGPGLVGADPGRQPRAAHQPSEPRTPRYPWPRRRRSAKARSRSHRSADRGATSTPRRERRSRSDRPRSRQDDCDARRSPPPHRPPEFQGQRGADHVEPPAPGRHARDHETEDHGPAAQPEAPLAAHPVPFPGHRHGRDGHHGFEKRRARYSAASTAGPSTADDKTRLASPGIPASADTGGSNRRSRRWNSRTAETKSSREKSGQSVSRNTSSE